MTLPPVRVTAVRSGSGDRGIDGVEAVRRLAAEVPGTPVVMLTSYAGVADVVRALEAGARGYALKAGPPDDLFWAVRSAAAGGMGPARHRGSWATSSVKW
jgi:DNA-binding NarL/FixJ family response regulator